MGSVIKYALLAVVAVVILAAAIMGVNNRHAPMAVSEGDSIKAAALIQAGSQLKTGVDRLLAGNKIPFTAIDTNISHTFGNNRLFSPMGGGITPPGWSMANQPSTDGTAATGDIWHFFQAAVPGLGTGAPEMLAVLKVSRSVCDEVNRKLGKSSPPLSDLGNFYSTIDTLLFDGWPAAFKGSTAGCVQNNSGSSSGYFFFEILAIQ